MLIIVIIVQKFQTVHQNWVRIKRGYGYEDKRRSGYEDKTRSGYVDKQYMEIIRHAAKMHGANWLVHT